MRREVFIDCHDGLSDALALAMVRGANDVDIVGVTQCYRENPLPSHLPVAELARMLGVGADTAAGSTAPILYRPGGPKPRRRRDAPPAGGYAWELLYKKARASTGLTVLTLGPLTNLAIALFRYPELTQLISKVVIGGGSGKWGDVSPFAERSVYEDACACQAVLQSGIPVELVGLDAAAQSCVKQADVTQMLKGRGSELARKLTAHYADRAVGDEVVLLSAAAAAVFVEPSVARMTHYHVVVEMASSGMYGRTVVDWRLYEEGPKETAVAAKMNAPRFEALLRDTIGAL